MSNKKSPSLIGEGDLPGAGYGVRTRGLNFGKVACYRYTKPACIRPTDCIIANILAKVKHHITLRKGLTIVSSTPSTTQAPSFRSTIRGILPSIIVNGVLPYIIYQLLKSQTSFSDLTILFISAVPAILGGIVSIIRNRSMDLIAGITLVGIAVTIIAALIGGDPRLFLIRESFLTVALGIAFLISLLFPKPLWFYVIRYFAGGNDRARIAMFDNSWQYAGFRTFIRVLTLVWGLTYIGEFILRVILVYNMSIPQFLAISPFIFYGITFAVIAFTFAYSNRARRQGEERRKRLAETQAPATAEAEQA